jgi:mannitol-1-/sugar-/sorbitol-6-phosphatase
MREIRNQTVVVVAGAAGSGKSTVAAVAARALPAALIDIDVTFGPIVPLLAGHSHRVVRGAIYEALVDTAANAARAGAHVVIAAPFTRERRDPLAWEQLCERCAEAGAEAVLAWMRVPGATLIERLAARAADRDASKLANPAEWLREASPETPPNVPHIELDGTRAVDVTARALLAELAAREGKARAACSF